MRRDLKSALSLLLLLCVASPGLAADNKGPTKVIKRGRPAPESRNSAGAEIKNMEKPPDMPGITFPNAKFLYGYNSETKKGRNMSARFEVPDAGPNVIAYYKSALKSSGWKVNEEGVKENQVVASNTQYKSSVTITALKSSKPGCQVLFSYGTHQ